MNGWGFDFAELEKTHRGVIRAKDENGLMKNDVLVYFEFRHNIPAKEAAALLIKRLTDFQNECTAYNIV